MAGQQGRVVAILGPTNTGKTHLALERMLGHESGIIGLPLRLLAREVYDRAARARGAATVAMVTGEEKIVPARPRWFVCTTEAMPLDHAVDFVAIDEVQLAADDERGHVFTDRVLNARGQHETLFLGAETVRPILRRLVPEAEYVARPRFSKLIHAGYRKITRLPRRTAVVAFSAAEVYRVAEALRSHRGGAAVVLGALSPRARNAQIALFQSGEVDYLVATDAIGMGLNMDVDHVAFAGLRKFDGVAPRALDVTEISQIAGRAGRYMNDGTFGTTADVGELDPAVALAVEGHAFPPLTRVRWRNSRLETRSLGALLASLEAPPPHGFLVRQRRAVDHQALATLARNPEIAALAADPAGVRLLWDVCQVPDYRKTLAEEHVRFVDRVFRHLRGGEGRLPGDWVARLIERLDRVDGDIDTLMARMAHVRTWSYVAHRPGWLDDPAPWQERTRAIEDRLSDALHRGLTQRFVDQRTAVLVRRLDAETAAAEVDEGGAVTVDGEVLGQLSGFRFVARPAATRREGRAVWAVARRALGPLLEQRAATLLADRDPAVLVAEDGTVAWDGAAVARLVPGPAPLAPRVELLAGDLIAETTSAALTRHLQAWLDRWLDRALGALRALARARLEGAARGLAFALTEALGSVPTENVREQVRSLSEADRVHLARFGVRLGRHHVYVQGALKPRALAARALLWGVASGERDHPPVPTGGERWLDGAADLPAGFLTAIGFVPIGRRALRVDQVEVVGRALRKAARSAGATFAVPETAIALAGPEDLDGLLAATGFQHVPAAVDAPPRARAKPRRAPRRPPAPHPHSPFAKLADWGNAR
ncbi:MAG: disulfide oxidoreductase [Alphaproteobacteria bacterium]|nr:disulfide oxidoreductase [Alphaproteobacteria bacterium]